MGSLLFALAIVLTVFTLFMAAMASDAGHVNQRRDERGAVFVLRALVMVWVFVGRAVVLGCKHLGAWLFKTPAQRGKA